MRISDSISSDGSEAGLLAIQGLGNRQISYGLKGKEET
jgi:hypothetical protein